VAPPHVDLSAASRQAEAERQRQAAEAAQQAEAERQRQAAEAARQAEAERQRQAAEAARQAEAERQRQAAEAAQQAALGSPTPPPASPAPTNDVRRPASPSRSESTAIATVPARSPVTSTPTTGEATAASPRAEPPATAGPSVPAAESIAPAAGSLQQPAPATLGERSPTSVAVVPVVPPRQARVVIRALQPLEIRFRDPTTGQERPPITLSAGATQAILPELQGLLLVVRLPERLEITVDGRPLPAPPRQRLRREFALDPESLLAGAAFSPIAEDPPRAQPTAVSPTNAAAARCRAISARAQIGEPLSAADLALLRNGCRG
jgi:hypothetical protein